MTAPSRPRALHPRWEGIPAALQAMPAWLVWRYEQREGKWTKAPRMAIGKGYAKTTESDTWAPFPAAQRASVAADGVGIVLTADLVGVDLDHVIDEAGDIEPWAAEVLDRFKGCYCERSPGGDGLRIFCRGVTCRCGKGGPDNRCEVYDKTSPRYLTVTGHRVGDGDVIEAQAALNWLHEAHMVKAAAPAPTATTAAPAPSPSDVDVIRRASAAANGAKFSRLFAGHGGDDDSANDAALVAMLAFWTQDPAQIDRIFRRSGLMREKWDSPRGASTYGAVTIDNIITKGGEHLGDRGTTRAPAQGHAADRAAAIKRAAELLAPSLKDRDAPAYPVHALGLMAEVCNVIATAAQVQPAMAGQCLLGAASLLTQGLFNVETLAGVRPLSLYLLTLGDSGDGKSTAQTAALQPVHDWQREAGERYRADLADFEQAKARRRAKKTDSEAMPELPASPYRLTRDATVEGLRRDLDTGPCAQGVYTDEAAAILSGYGMTPEQRSKTAGVFSGLWDSGHLSVSRATGGRVERYGRRVAMHWLIQPMAAADAVGDPLLTALGFWPRFLAAWPAAQPPRLALPFKAETLPEVRRYWRRCITLLAEPLPDDATTCPTLGLTDEARTILGAAFERFEVSARRGDLRPVKAFALRGIEQTCRVAGVLAAFGGRDEVDAHTARHALALVAYSLETWRCLIDEGAADPTAAAALRLYQWLTKQPDWRARLATIVKDGPAIVRSKDRRNAALDVLVLHELVHVDDGEAVALEPPR